MKAGEISNFFKIMCLLLCHNHMGHPVNIIGIIGCSFQMIAHYKNRGQMFLSGFYDFTWIFFMYGYRHTIYQYDLLFWIIESRV